MDDPRRRAILRSGVDAWRQWRGANPDATADLRTADLARADLSGAYLTDALLPDGYNPAWLAEASRTAAHMAWTLASGTS